MLLVLGVVNVSVFMISVVQGFTIRVILMKDERYSMGDTKGMEKMGDSKVGGRRDSKLNTKGSEMWWIIVMGIVALVAVIIIILIFRSSVGQSKDVTDNTFSGFNDKDCDKTADFLDSCPCDESIQDKKQFEASDKKCGTSCDGFIPKPKCDT